MNKNEIVARWMGLIIHSKDFNDYKLLHEVWEKFRDLKFEDEYKERFFEYRRQISFAILFRPIAEAFDELCKGIIWAESLKNKEV